MTLLLKRYIRFGAATGVDDDPGAIRIDLGTQIGPHLDFPYANDTYTSHSVILGDETTACAFMGGY
jgi:hypothetical protein